MSKENEARLQQWQEDAGTDLLWAVQNKLEGSGCGQVSSPSDPKPFFDDKN